MVSRLPAKTRPVSAPRLSEFSKADDSCSLSRRMGFAQITPFAQKVEPLHKKSSPATGQAAERLFFPEPANTFSDQRRPGRALTAFLFAALERGVCVVLA